MNWVSSVIFRLTPPKTDCSRASLFGDFKRWLKRQLKTLIAQGDVALVTGDVDLRIVRCHSPISKMLLPLALRQR